MKQSEFHKLWWILRFILDFGVILSPCTKTFCKLGKERSVYSLAQWLFYLMLERCRHVSCDLSWTFIKSCRYWSKGSGDVREPYRYQPDTFATPPEGWTQNQRHCVSYSPASRSLLERCSGEGRSELRNRRRQRLGDLFLVRNITFGDFLFLL